MRENQENDVNKYENNETNNDGSKSVLAILAKGIVTCAVIGVATFSGLKTCKTAAEAPATGFEKMAQVIKQALNLNPVITEEATVIIKGTNDITELAIVEDEFVQEYVYTHSWAGSEKIIKLKSKAVAKIGYKFNSPLELNFTNGMEQVDIRIPEPTLLSLEMEAPELESDEGWWNKLNDYDREHALKALKERAKESIVDRNLLLEADKRFLGKLKMLIHEDLPEIKVKRIIP